VVVSESGEEPFSEFTKNYGEGPYGGKVLNLLGRLRSMGNLTGILDEFLKLDESEDTQIADDVCALFDDPAKEMRLFGIKISGQIFVVGGGGPKPKRIKKWQECLKLSKAARFMMAVSFAIRNGIKCGKIKISPDGMRLTGDLFLTI
jgi:hypothetical protein